MTDHGTRTRQNLSQQELMADKSGRVGFQLTIRVEDEYILDRSLCYLASGCVVRLS